MKAILTLLYVFVLSFSLAAQTNTIHVKKGPCNCRFILEADSGVLNKTLRLDHYSISGVPPRKTASIRTQLDWKRLISKTISQNAFEQEFCNSLCREDKYILKTIRISALPNEPDRFVAVFEFTERQHTYK